jgi:predicted lipoprotein
MRLILAFCFALATPAAADVADALNDVILPGFQDFATATATLDQAAQGDCAPEALQDEWNAAFDAWLRVGFLRLGPGEGEGRNLAIAFWPDPKGLGAKAQAGILKTGEIPAEFGEVSVAARGLFGLERLLYPQDEIFKAEAACPLIRATTADLARMATELAVEWPAYAARMQAPGAAGETEFLTEAEVKRALLTALVTGVEFQKDSRLGRPLGDFDRPRPERAEARASGRSLRNVDLSLRALRDLTAALAPEAAVTLAALDKAIVMAEGLDDPAFAGVAEPGSRLKVEILQQAVTAAKDAMMAELVPALGVGTGFNAADGD